MNYGLHQLYCSDAEPDSSVCDDTSVAKHTPKVFVSSVAFGGDFELGEIV